MKCWVKFIPLMALGGLALFSSACSPDGTKSPPPESPADGGGAEALPLQSEQPAETSTPGGETLGDAAPVQAGQGTPTRLHVELADFGPAPELHNEIWLNTDAPLRLADLRGQVVLLEMWTFG